MKKVVSYAILKHINKPFGLFLNFILLIQGTMYNALTSSTNTTAVRWSLRIHMYLPSNKANTCRIRGSRISEVLPILLLLLLSWTATTRELRYQFATTLAHTSRPSEGLIQPIAMSCASCDRELLIDTTQSPHTFWYVLTLFPAVLHCSFMTSTHVCPRSGTNQSLVCHFPCDITFHFK